MNEIEFRALLEIIEKFSQEGHNNEITREDNEQLSEIRQFLTENEGNFAYFCEKINEVYTKGDFPTHSILSFIIGRFILHHHDENQILNSKFKAYIMELLDAENRNLVVFGLQLFRMNRLLFREELSQFYQKIFEFWEADDIEIKGLAFWALENYAIFDHQTFLPYFSTMLSKAIGSNNQLVVTYSLKLLASTYLYAFRQGISIPITLSNINEIIQKYQEIEDANIKRDFLDGISTLLYEFNEYNPSWIDFFINDYRGTDDITIKSELLRNLVHLPNNKDFSDIDKEKYLLFFISELEFILDNDLELPNRTIVYSPNQLRDIMDNIEQLSFKLPLIVEKLLPFYEQVFVRYVPELIDNRPGFQGMLWQKLHSIYINIINYYTKINKSEKLVQYFQRISELSFSDKEKLNWEIKELQHIIGLKIAQRNFMEAKEDFTIIKSVFEEYESNTGEIHLCYPIWVIFEDLIYILDCTIENYNRELERFEEHKATYIEAVPENFLDLLERFELISRSTAELEDANSHSRCQALVNTITENISEILEHVLSIEGPLSQFILKDLIEFEQRKVKDIATRKNILYSLSSRRAEGMTEVYDEDLNLWSDVIQCLKMIDLNSLYSDELPHEDTIIEDFSIELRRRFDNVVPKQYITGTSHIDIVINNKIAIEIKKIESNTPKDELVGQIVEDIRITDFKYGISYGIDTTSSKKYTQLNNLVFGDYRNFKYIIKPFGN